MMLEWLIILLILLILMVMMVMNFLISKKMFKNREKSSPFECGFDSFSGGRKPFSLQFYLISIIFLIFDVEISMILLLVEIQEYLNYLVSLNFIYILMILLFGLDIEWVEGALKWFK